MIALLSAWCLAGPVSDGAAAWQAGDLEGAVAAWSAPVEAGWGSARVKFDLGNAWYRRGDLPRAIAYWRAAGHIAPRDGGVSHNLALARADLEGAPPPAGDPALWMRIVTPGELGLLGLLLAGVGSAALVRRRWTRAGPRAPWLGLWALGVAIGLVAARGWWLQATLPVGVVVDAPALARLAPDATAEVRRTLPPGAELQVLQSSAGFLLVEDGDGQRGWVPDGAVLRVPR